MLAYMCSRPYSVNRDPNKLTKWELYFNLLILCTSYMSSLMYGDIIPYTVSEEVLGLIQMIVGRMFVSFVFAEVSSYISSHYSDYNNHIEIVNKVDKWMQLNNIDPPLKKRV